MSRYRSAGDPLVAALAEALGIAMRDFTAQWIPVSRLPKIGQEVMAWVHKGTRINYDSLEEIPYTGLWATRYEPDNDLFIRDWAYVTHWQEMLKGPGKSRKKIKIKITVTRP